MDYYAGIDVSLELSSVCILDTAGLILREAKVASEPEALAASLADLNLPLTHVGRKAGPLSNWLHASLQKAGHDVVLLETQHVKAALSTMIVKIDRRGARGVEAGSCCAGRRASSAWRVWNYPANKVLLKPKSSLPLRC
jgi:transposase